MNPKQTWPILRTVLFFIIGLMNTLLIRAEDIGTWKNYLGYLLLALALMDTVLLIRKRYGTKT